MSDDTRPALWPTDEEVAAALQSRDIKVVGDVAGRCAFQIPAVRALYRELWRESQLPRG